MGMNVSSAKNSRRGRTGRAGRAPMAEINVTPFVDVMLVLLIIFMVAAPMLTVGVPVDLPKTQAAALPSESKPVTVSIDGNGDVFLSEAPIAVEELEAKLRAVAAANATAAEDQKVFVRADRTTNYDAVMNVTARISAAGFTKLGFVTAQDTGN